MMLLIAFRKKWKQCLFKMFLYVWNSLSWMLQSGCAIFTHLPFSHGTQSSLDVKLKEEASADVDASSILSKFFEDESMFPKAPSRFIISGSGGPFAHLSYPVGEMLTVGATRKTVSHTPVKLLAPNQSFGAEEQTVQASATATVRRSVELRETVVELPPPLAKIDKDKVCSPSDSASSSEKVQEFLSRVPNLSYMLSTTLSRPTGK